jgi:hypothetical protein
LSERSFVPIGDARRISRERGCPIVVVFAIHPDRERFTVTSYGATKALCRVGGDYARQFSESVLQRIVVASEVEPLDVPDAPAVWRTAGEAPRYAVGDAKHVELWDAIDELIGACGGNRTAKSVARMTGVVRVERALVALAGEPKPWRTAP